LPRRFRGSATGAVSAAGLPFLLILFLWARKEKNAAPAGRLCLIARRESSKWIWVETGKVGIILPAFRDADNLMEHVNVICQPDWHRSARFTVKK
jgi:hypothetical protein